MGKFNGDMRNADVLLAAEGGGQPSVHRKRAAFEGAGRRVIDGPPSETREPVAGFEPAAAPLPPAVADAAGGIKGRRPSKKDKLRAAAAAADGPAPARTRTPR